MPRPSELARKGLVKAVPTVAVDGNVIKWEVEYRYGHNGYQSTYRHDFEPTELKPEADWSQAELLAECPFAQWQAVFDSQYDSAGPEAQAAAPTRKSDFDVRKMRAS